MRCHLLLKEWLRVRAAVLLASDYANLVLVTAVKKPEIDPVVDFVAGTFAGVFAYSRTNSAVVDNRT